MTESSFPDILFRVSINAENGQSLRVLVKEIPCKRLNKVIKTSSGKTIKLAEIMQPQSVVDARFVMEHTYCLCENDVQGAISLLVERARQKANAQLAHAQAVRDATYGSLDIRQE